MKVYYSIILTLILAFLNLTFSLDTLYLEISIDKDYNVSLVTYYFLETQEEKYEKSGNIEVRILDEKNNIIKRAFSNVSKEDFIVESFSPTKGKVTVELPYTVKNFLISLPSNSLKLQILVENELKLEFLIINKSLIYSNYNNLTTSSNNQEKSFPNILFIISLFLAFLGLIVIILKRVKFS